MSAKITVVHLFSFSYSGNTWLNLMLGAHPEAFSVGEVKTILLHNKPVCTVHVDNCPFWTGFKWPSEENFYLQLARLTGKRVFVVNNSRKFMPHEKHADVQTRFIHIMRDGRVATASWLRKNPGKSMWAAARLWRHDVRRNERLLRRQPKGSVEQVAYEHLLDNAEHELRRLSRHIGVDYDPIMAEYWRATENRHYLGGNQGTILSMLRMTDPAAQLPQNDYTRKWDLNYYQGSNAATAAKFVDDRWKKELTDGQLRVFGLIAGLKNRKYGYPRSLDRDTPIVTAPP